MPRTDPAPRDRMNGNVRIERFGAAHAAELDAAVADATRPGRHGRLAEWQAALDALSNAAHGWRIDDGVLVAGGPLADPGPGGRSAAGLVPWRKGPLRLAGVDIDTEWRSDWKWGRVAPQVELAGRHVLDIGGGNGYFAWRMLAAGAASVTVCDPTLVFWMQHRAIARLAGPAPLDFLPLRFEDLPIVGAFDAVFSMGVLYHRRDPLEHLDRIHSQLVSGGTLVLETLILPGSGDGEFDPPDRYANMRNVHRLPTIRRLEHWLERSGYSSIEVRDRTWTTVDEQRPTAWMPFHSLAHALAEDGRTTVEGHSPPLRAVVTASRA